MHADEVLDIFKQTGALLEGHFILSSGLHSATYLQCALALRSPAVAAKFGAAIGGQFGSRQIQTVASPAIGGIVIGYEVARHLGVPFVWTERKEGRMTLRRGFTMREGERVLVVEDVITTGGSTRDTIAALSGAGAEVVAAAAIIDRSGGKADVGVPLSSLVAMEVPVFDSQECDLCKQGTPATKPGSRRAVGRRQ